MRFSLTRLFLPQFLVPLYQGSSDGAKLAIVLVLVPVLNELCTSFLRLGKGADNLDDEGRPMAEGIQRISRPETLDR